MTDPAMPIRSLVHELALRAWSGAVADGALPGMPDGGTVPAIEVLRPADPEHGDFALNLALKLARPLRRPPMDIAAVLVAALRGADTERLLETVDVAPPGFVNLRLAPGTLEEAVDAARAAGTGFGRLQEAAPRRIDLEFVSANPSGPLHIGNARGAFVGDLLSRVLSAAGHQVTREYYFNDFGAQVRVLGASVRAIRAGEPLPEEAYRGAYVADLAATLPDDVWARAVEIGADAERVVGEWASERVRAGIEASL